MLEALREKVEKLKSGLVDSVNCIMDLHRKLKANALRGEALSTPNYIQMVIKNEEEEGAEGFQERVLSLKELLKLSKLKNKILTDEEFKDQFNSVH